MARNFNGTTQYLSNANAVLTAVPITMACWFYSTSDAAAQSLISLGVSGSGDNRHTLIAAGNLVGDPVLALSRTTSNVSASTSTGYTTNAWQHACAVFAADADRRVYVNGGNEGTNASSRIPSGINSTHIGTQQPVANLIEGRIAEAGIWNVALNTSEIAALAAGVSPLRIRPNNLVAYWPLFGVGSPEPDYSNGGFHMTLNASPTQVDHAPVMPAFYVVDWFGAFTPPAGGGLSVNVSETVTLSESLTIAIVSANELIVAVSETVTLTEASAANLIILVSTGETITITESAVSQLDSNISASETLTLSDQAALNLVLLISASDTVTLSESTTLNLVSQVSAGETVTLTEATGQSLSITVSGGETITLTESVSMAGLAVIATVIGSVIGVRTAGTVIGVRTAGTVIGVRTTGTLRG